MKSCDLVFISATNLAVTRNRGFIHDTFHLDYECSGCFITLTDNVSLIVHLYDILFPTTRVILIIVQL